MADRMRPEMSRTANGEFQKASINRSDDGKQAASSWHWLSGLDPEKMPTLPM